MKKHQRIHGLNEYSFIADEVIPSCESHLKVGAAATLLTGAKAGLTLGFHASKKHAWKIAEHTVRETAKQGAKQAGSAAAQAGSGCAIATAGVLVAAGLAIIGGYIGYQVHAAGNEVDKSLDLVKVGLNVWKNELAGDTSKLAADFKKVQNGRLASFATALHSCRNTLKNQRKALNALVKEIETVIAMEGIPEAAMKVMCAGYQARLKSIDEEIRQLELQASVGNDLLAVIDKLEKKAKSIKNRTWVETMCGGISLSITGVLGACTLAGAVAVCPWLLLGVGVAAVGVLGHSFYMHHQNGRRDRDLKETRREVEKTMQHFRNQTEAHKADMKKIYKMMEDACNRDKNFSSAKSRQTNVPQVASWRQRRV